MSVRSRVPLNSVVSTLQIPAALSAAIVAQVSARLERWMLARHRTELIVPRLEDLTLERGGRVWWFRGRRVSARHAVQALGALLESLLARAPHRQIPPGLLYIVSRAVDERHLAPVESVREFARAVARHAPSRPMQAIDAFVARYVAERSGLRPIGPRSTISDVRRWRRAGGVSLRTIARDTGIPISILRELEWGVYENWWLPYAKPAVTAYAERAGLDPSAVLTVLAHEQQKVPRLLPIGAGEASLIERARRLNLEDRVVPYTLAAGLLFTLALAAPKDPAPSVSSPAAMAPAAGSSAATSPAATLIAYEKSPEPEKVAPPAQELEPPAPPPAAEPDRRPQTRRATQPTSLATAATSVARADLETPRETPAALERRRPSRQGDTRHPLLRLARAIAGDGTHRVEPFPRVSPQ